MHTGKKRTFALHRIVMDALPDDLIDHKNGNPLDCRKENLRRSNKRGNSHNIRHSKNQKQGKYKGVFPVTNTGPAGKPWRAQIGLTDQSGKLISIYLGCFWTPEDAARAYDAKAKELFGENAATNLDGTEWDAP
jgi:hypothetical protein